MSERIEISARVSCVDRCILIDVSLDHPSPVPLYHQLSHELREAIADGRLPKGTFLDNEIQLAKRWQVSRPTVRRAIQGLVNDGLLVRQRGVGTQVVNDVVQPTVRLSGLYDDLVRQGRDPTTSVLIHERVVADDAVAEELELPQGSTVVHLLRCRYSDGLRLAILESWLPLPVAGELTTASLASESLFSLLRSVGIRQHYATQTIGARAASPTDAALLGRPVGVPLLTMRRAIKDRSGRLVDLSDHIYDAAAYTISSIIVDT